MSRYEIRGKKENYSILTFNKFNKKNIIEDIQLLHFYDKKQSEKDTYYVFDTKTNKIIFEEN